MNLQDITLRLPPQTIAELTARAVSWPGVQHRLARHGHQLRRTGSGLTLHDAKGARLCTPSKLGFAYARLVRRFQAPMPGHPHRMSHLLTKKAAAVPRDGPLELFESVQPFLSTSRPRSSAI